MEGKSASAIRPIDLASCGVDLSGASFSRQDGVTTLSFRLLYDDVVARGECGGALEDLYVARDTPLLGLVMAQGVTDTFDAHATSVAAQALSASGASSAASASSLLVVHGVLMAVTWLCIAPLATAISRFGRNRFAGGLWFQLHRGLMSLAWLLTTVGFAVGVAMVPQHFDSLHAQLGLTVFLLTFAQPLIGILRPGKTSSRRSAWEGLHKGLGIVLLFLGFMGVLLGTTMTSKAVALLVPALVIVLIVVGVFVLLEYLAVRRGDAKGASGSSTATGASAPALLAPGWQEAVDPASGHTYYLNPKTGASQWEPPFLVSVDTPPRVPPPPSPPPGTAWAEYRDAASGSSYWHNANTGETSWQRPVSQPNESGRV